MSKTQDDNKLRQKIGLQKKFNQRITIARQGREAFTEKDYVTATKKYNEYLTILAEMKEVQDIFKITPKMFDEKKEVTEMLLISHIYWELSRINEMTPKLQSTFHNSLAQFVKFTINQPYQVLNAEMLRKYIKKNKSRSTQTEALNSAYQQIFTESKKCYIATYCFGDTHRVTNDLRDFKTFLLTLPKGQELVRVYYKFSPKLISFSKESWIFRLILKGFAYPTLWLFAKIFKKVWR